MKLIVFLLLPVLFCHQPIYGQEIAFHNDAFTKQQHAFYNADIENTTKKKHCRASYVGLGLAVTGVAILAPTFAYMFFKGDIAGSNENTLTPQQTNVTDVFWCAGAGALVAGIYLAVRGGKYEKKHPEKFSIVSYRNQVGLAYKF